jgi:DNA-binding NarL/FixJ family response regulator
MVIVILTSIQLFGEGLASFFNTRQEVSVLAVAQSFSILHEAMNQSEVDLALIDVTQGIDLEEVRALTNRFPMLTLIAIGLKADQKEIVRCGRAGFSGYVLRDASLNQLQNAMEDAIAGRLSCSPEVSGELLRALYHEAHIPYSQEIGEALTPRECEVLLELGNGLSNKEIARKLCLSISTVKHHVHKVLEKLQVGRRAEAMRQVREMPWIASSPALLQGAKSP